MQGDSGNNGEPSISPTVLPGKRQVSRSRDLKNYLIGGLKQEQVQQILPSDIFKKFRLLRRFKREFKHRIVRDRVPNYFLQFEYGVYNNEAIENSPEETKSSQPRDELVFVEKLQKIKEKAVLIWLSNGTV